MLEGPTAIAFVEADGDPVAVAKALSDTAKETKVLALRGGTLSGRTISGADVEELAKLPAPEVVKGQLVGAIVAPLTQLAALLAAPLRDLVGLIDARIAQLGGGRRHVGSLGSRGGAVRGRALSAGETSSRRPSKPAGEAAEGDTPRRSEPGAGATRGLPRTPITGTQEE